MNTELTETEKPPERSESIGRSVPAHRIRRFLLLTGAGALGGVALFVLIVISCNPVRIPESGSRQRVLFYAAPTSLTPGTPLDASELEERLRRLAYRSADEPVEPGQYRLTARSGTLFLRPFRYPGHDFAGGRIRLRFQDGLISRVELIDPLEEVDLRLEPERIAGFEGKVGAVLQPLKLEEAPPLLVRSIIAIEDRRFYRHPGIDPIGSARAVWANLRRGKPGQGGSTLTQQLARSLFLHNRKTVFRKAVEAILAVGLEIRYSKKEILESYLNAVYWGTWGPLEIRGAREASQYYLGCDLEKADAAGIALLVALVPAPNAFSPYNRPERARARRDLVLRLLAERGVLSQAEAKKAMAQPLPSTHRPLRSAEASYFLDAARDEVERRAPKGTLNKPGTTIFTTLDARDQAAAVEAVDRGLASLEKNYRRLRKKGRPLQAAVASIDVETGGVRALVGGRSFLEHPFNRAIDGKRQPGSLFKPFVYLAAFRKRVRGNGTSWSPATWVEDEPFSTRAGRKMWRPQNYDHEFRGPVTVRHALEHSLNVPTARVAMEVGIGRVADAARDLGVRSPLHEVPSLALGTSDVSLLEVTSAYAALANGGTAHAPTFLLGITGPGGNQIALEPISDPPGVEPAEAYLVTALLQGVIESGTGSRARALGVRGDVAGKTGTTDDYHDAWFAGYTPRRAIGVWVGFDRDAAVGLSGASAALPIWSAAMAGAEGRFGDGRFIRPRGVVRATIDPESGQLATEECPTAVEEVFLSGTEPEDECELHRPDVLTRMRRWFGF